MGFNSYNSGLALTLISDVHKEKQVLPFYCFAYIVFAAQKVHILSGLSEPCKLALETASHSTAILRLISLCLTGNSVILVPPFLPAISKESYRHDFVQIKNT